MVLALGEVVWELLLLCFSSELLLAASWVE